MRELSSSGDDEPHGVAHESLQPVVAALQPPRETRRRPRGILGPAARRACRDAILATAGISGPTPPLAQPALVAAADSLTPVQGFIRDGGLPGLVARTVALAMKRPLADDEDSDGDCQKVLAAVSWS